MTVSSCIDTCYFMSILLLTQKDLSTSAFEWHSAKAHLTIFLHNTSNWSPQLSFLVITFFKKWFTWRLWSSSVTFFSWYLIHSSPTFISFSGLNIWHMTGNYPAMLKWVCSFLLQWISTCQRPQEYIFYQQLLLQIFDDCTVKHLHAQYCLTGHTFM